MLFWIDLETTGLNPRRDSIIEVALIVTTRKHLEVRHKETWLVEGPDPTEPKIIEMHSKSGLLTERANSVPTSLAKLDNELVDRVDWRCPMMRPMLAGSSVHFDLEFLRVHTPKFADRLNYRLMDVSGLAGALEMMDKRLKLPSWDAPRPHRALPDIERSLQLMREFRDAVRK